MDDFSGILTEDFGFKRQGKSASMASSRNSSSYGLGTKSSAPIFDDRDRDGILFNDVFGGPPKYSSESRGSSFDYDSVFKDLNMNTNNVKSSTMPVFDKPVYDDDIFEGFRGLKSASVNSSAVKHEDVFASISASPPKSRSHSSSAFDDLLGNLGREETELKKESMQVENDSSAFDDLLPGFGDSSSPNRSTSKSVRSHKPSTNSAKRSSNAMENPFVILETTATPPVTTAGSPDPLEEISKIGSSGSRKMDNSSASRGVFDDVDPPDGLGKSIPTVSTEIKNGVKDRSPLRTGSSRNTTYFSVNEMIEKHPMENNEGLSFNSRKKPVDNFQESPQTPFDMPTTSTAFRNSAGRRTSPPAYVNTSHNDPNFHVNVAGGPEEISDPLDYVWLTVSDIPLFTQPTSAPPPSRPPPPRPSRVSRSEDGSFPSSNSRKMVNDFSSSANSPQYSYSPESTRAARSSVTSQIEELEDFAMGRTGNDINEHGESLSGEDLDSNSVAVASAAAMKDAMDRAEAKFRHAREMREREYLKTARNKENVQLDKGEKNVLDGQEREIREKQERQQGEEEEREQRRRERERERAREIEREKEEREKEQRRMERERIEREREVARHAVERATREARERAAVEARLKAERAAVEKANSDARGRAERAAVQRAQAEARERAAAAARERAERAAAEARERATAEAREREAREKAAVAKAERAAAEARERASTAGRANQQKNEDNDLESFFSMGSRPSSAPRPSANSSDPAFDTQNKGAAPEASRRTSVGSSSSMRKASSTTNIVDDWTSIFGAPASTGEFQEFEGESEERRRARLERHQRTQERAAKALDEKNQRDLQAQREQAERHRIAETFDAEIKRWAAGKEGNLRALLSTLQYVLWPECGWLPVSLTDLITGAAVKKAYRKATLCIHPDKVQQKGANLHQKYIAEKVFDLLKEAWNKFNSEELF
ncbi:auxilin-related protein 2-like [Tripterygium wilfordii]|uniref:auxilin-related protein 2-like n=1 Tax=Tripterygium wilfordii TaxID=458696 RepID=UPI0018F8340F|nr:auxilin-related protein 2-like [Tripterygium wilfordii]XP_038713544.1 auxilin-related protein 2-like [Tripterygium wilfordii]